MDAPTTRLAPSTGPAAPTERIVVGGHPHEHALVRSGRATRTTVVQVDGDESFVVPSPRTAWCSSRPARSGPDSPATAARRSPGPTTGSSPPASPRGGATAGTGPAASPGWTSPRSTPPSRHRVSSPALRQTIPQVGKAVLEAHPEVAAVGMSCPEKQHAPMDLTSFGTEKPDEVLLRRRPSPRSDPGRDRARGLLDAPRARATVPGSC